MADKIISFTIKDSNNFINDLLDAYNLSFPGRPTSTTKANWAREKIIEGVKNVYRSYKRNIAEEIARQEALEAANLIEIE